MPQAINGNKVCSSCREEKVAAEGFAKNKVTKDGFQNVCKTCKVKIHRNWKYSLQSGKLDSMYTEQENKCAICKKYSEDLVIDHCHKSGEVRELLCRLCNAMLGMCNDNIETLQVAINYLTAWQEKIKRMSA